MQVLFFFIYFVVVMDDMDPYFVMKEAEDFFKDVSMEVVSHPLESVLDEVAYDSIESATIMHQLDLSNGADEKEVQIE